MAILDLTRSKADERKRKIKRRYLLYYTCVYDSEGRQLLGNLEDITPTSAMIVSNTSLPEGKIVHLRIELTEDVSEKPYLEISGQVRWHKPDIEPSMQNIGIEFLSITAEQRQIIEKIVTLHGFRDNVLPESG